MVEKIDTFAARFEKLKGPLSYQELSDAIFKKMAVRISPQAMHKWVKEDGGISIDNAKIVAAYFGKRPGWLLFGEGEEQAAGPNVNNLIVDLPEDSGQMTLDLLEFQLERGKGLIASDQVAGYFKMIDSLKKDLEKRKNKGR